MKQHARRKIVFILVLFAHTLTADPLIYFFFSPYPYVDYNTQKMAKKLHNPQKLTAYQQKLGIIPKVDGIYCSYAGYLTVSSLHGRVEFPRKHSTNELIMIVTPRITPVISVGNTLDHILMDPAAHMYTYTRITDTKLGKSFWRVEVTKQPDDRIVPSNALIVFAQPKKIYIPTGITYTHQSPHMILPPIYVKKGIAYADRALYILTVKQFFAPISFSFKKEKQGYIRQIKP